MQNFKKINTIVGLIVLALSTLVYALTMESSGSFWDCGEFVSGCWKLQVVHAPGAPFFLMLGRLFTLFAFGDVTKVAAMVNFMSALGTGASIMFAYWSIVLLAKKVFFKDVKNPTTGEAVAVIGAALIASACATFLDSLWFSAVEGEVYALSQFFLAIIVWAILKWDESESQYADRWLIFIAYMVGLSIGVHLLSLLALPFIAVVYYFKNHKTSILNFFLAAGAGFAILGFAMKFVISYTQAFMAGFDKFFVNSLGLPFYSGVAFFFILLIGLLAFGIYYTQKTNRYYWNLGIICAAFVYIGYLSYAMVPIRSMANTPINMNRPTDPFSIKSYVDREQYGDRPLAYGPVYTATYQDIKGTTDKGDRFYKGENKYEFAGKKIDYTFDDKVCIPFPRLGFWMETEKHDGYRTWLHPSCDIIDRATDQPVQHFEAGQRQQAEQSAEQRNASEGQERYVVKDKVGMKENIWYFLKYQLGYMYFRYFMWNFSGRQDDIQGTYANDNGRWISGIPFIDNSGLFFTPEYPQKNLSKEMAENKGRNKFYMLPFIFGLIGLVYTLYKQEETFLKIAVLFIVTGIFQIVYQNEPPIEPRERDYALAGSFWTYCFWIGFGVLAIWDYLRKKLAEVPAAAIAVSVTVAAPILMGAQGWDDHTRHNRYTARDLAHDYLESCQPNAVLFTMGDNDTYPLWYAQEVEGIRPDVRVINLSLLGVDWYVQQLKYKWNESAPVKITFTDAQIQASNRDVVRYSPAAGISESTPLDLKKVMQFIASEDPNNKVTSGQGERESFYPTKTFFLDIDTNKVKTMNMLDPADYAEITPRMQWAINSNALYKNHLITLDIVANNIMERPIYFAVSVTSDAYVGLDKYFQLEGLTYRIVPRQSKGGHREAPVRNDAAYTNMMTKFKFGGVENNPDLYIDENIQRMFMNIRGNYARLAQSFLEKGDSVKAAKVIDFSLEKLPNEHVPFNVFNAMYPSIYYAAGQTAKAEKLSEELLAIAKDELGYWQYAYREELRKATDAGDRAYLSQLEQGYFLQSRPIQEQLYVLRELANSGKRYNSPLGAKYEKEFNDAQMSFTRGMKN